MRHRYVFECLIQFRSNCTAVKVDHTIYCTMKNIVAEVLQLVVDDRRQTIEDLFMKWKLFMGHGKKFWLINWAHKILCWGSSLMSILFCSLQGASSSPPWWSSQSFHCDGSWKFSYDLETKQNLPSVRA